MQPAGFNTGGLSFAELEFIKLVPGIRENKELARFPSRPLKQSVLLTIDGKRHTVSAVNEGYHHKPCGFACNGRAGAVYFDGKLLFRCHSHLLAIYAAKVIASGGMVNYPVHALLGLHVWRQSRYVNYANRQSKKYAHKLFNTISGPRRTNVELITAYRLDSNQPFSLLAGFRGQLFVGPLVPLPSDASLTVSHALRLWCQIAAAAQRKAYLLLRPARELNHAAGDESPSWLQNYVR